MINEIVSPLTSPPAVPVVADGQTTFNTRASAWLSYWKNNIYIEMESLIAKLNSFTAEVNDTTDVIEQIEVDVIQLKADTGQIKADTEDIRDGTEVFRDATETLRNETIQHIDNTFGSSNIWTEHNITTATYTASNLEVVRIDASTLGFDVIITLPINPNNRDMIEFVNVDFVKTNTVVIARGDALHRINGKKEDGDFNCNCIMKLVYDTATKNWMKG